MNLTDFLEHVKERKSLNTPEIYELMNRMSDDLISRDEVIKAADRHIREDGTLDDDISVILEEVNTVFGKQNVILELDKICYKLALANDLNRRSIEELYKIVEKGGVE